MCVTLGYTGFREFAPIVNPINPGLRELPLLFVYSRGQRNYQYHVEVHLRYHML